MAVRLSEQTVRGAVEAAVLTEAERLLAADALAEVTDTGGGAGAIVDDGGCRYPVWVGIVDGALTADCGCDAANGADDDTAEGQLCPHAVAVTLRMVRAGHAWSTSGAPKETDPYPPRLPELTTVAEKLSHDQLLRLVVDAALSDRRWEARLLREAGLLTAVTDDDAVRLRDLIDDHAAGATRGRWQMSDVVDAGEAIITEMEILAERPATELALAVVEHAATVWDGLAAHLFDDWEHYEGAPEEMGGRLREVHLQLCERLRPDPGALARRLREVVDAAEAASCLDAPEEYAHLLG